MSLARVEVIRHSLRRVRWSSNVGRWLLVALAAWGIAASARVAIAPPRPVVQHAPVPQTADLAAAGLAINFTRRYLTIGNQGDDARARALAPLVGQRLDPDAGLRAANTVRQRVLSADVVQQRRTATGLRVYTVAAQTDRAGTLYLSVTVDRARDGTLRLSGYPALVGAPAFAPAAEDGQLRDVTDDALRAVCARALRNYLLGAADNLRADLSDDARVALPGLRLRLWRVVAVSWSPGARSVLVTVEAAEAGGTDYTLRYELDVARVQDRWEIAAIQMDPTAS